MKHNNYNSGNSRQKPPLLLKEIMADDSTHPTGGVDFPLVCPLCGGRDNRFAGQDSRRHFYRCASCHLVFVPPNERLSKARERRHYLNHQNSPTDQKYRAFLDRLFTPMNARLPPHSHGLDFGCGPGPALHLLFEEAGHTMRCYDPYFAPQKELLDNTYDFITLSEVVEHLYFPGEVFSQLLQMVVEGGRIGIMTRFLLPDTPIETWFYKNDETHVCFFSTQTFVCMAKQFQAQLQLEDNVAILIKPISKDTKDL